MQAVAEVCAVCNEAKLECKAGQFRVSGAPTEGALKVLAEKLGVADEGLNSLLADKRAADPETNPEPVSRQYLARCAPACGIVPVACLSLIWAYTWNACSLYVVLVHIRS